MAKQKYKFERLTPIDNMDLDVYEEAIDYVFSNSDVKNVAISGAYSAGKSSVLASYKKKHDELRFLHISLAHFKSTDQEKENEKVLRFFYLLRDDIFDSKDRTKFFDYIIPVVPVVDSSNSYDQFISQLKSAGTFEKFDKSFLQGLSLYIDDMRLLKNIYNEFIIYYNRLNITELDCNKMLAIIAYKNLFPRDFADLQLNQGFVCTLFSKKDKFVENEVSEIKREIEEIRSKISSYKAEHLISMRELNVVFADKYLSGYDLRRQNDNDLSEFITKHLSGSSKDEYLHRRQMLKEKLDGNSDKLSQEILRLEQNIVELNDSLFSSFEQWDDSIQEKIFDHAVNNISCIIDNQDSIPTKLIKSLLNSESVSRDEKLDLFAAIMPGLCVDDIQSILILLNLTDYLKIFDMRSRPKFEINNESEKLLAAFKECHLIDSYEESTTKAGYYKVARPKATKALSKEPSTVT